MAAYDLLFAERWAEAQARCRWVLERGGRSEERIVPAVIGWLIAAWHGGERAAVATPLAALLKRLTPGGEYPRASAAGLCPHCGQAFRAHRRSWRQELRCRGCRRPFTPGRELPSGASLSSEPVAVFEPEFLLSAEDRLLRDLYLWRALARVEELGPRLTQLDVDSWESLRRELELAARIDPGCSDAPFLAGLIGMCQADAERRAEGRRQIEQALARGASHPVVTACLWHAGQLVQIPGPQVTDVLWDGTRRLDQLPALSELQQEFRRRWPARASGLADAKLPTKNERRPPTIAGG